MRSQSFPESLIPEERDYFFVYICLFRVCVIVNAIVCIWRSENKSVSSHHWVLNSSHQAWQLTHLVAKLLHKMRDRTLAEESSSTPMYNETCSMTFSSLSLFSLPPSLLSSSSPSPSFFGKVLLLSPVCQTSKLPILLPLPPESWDHRQVQLLGWLLVDSASFPAHWSIAGPPLFLFYAGSRAFICSALLFCRGSLWVSQASISPGDTWKLQKAP